MTTDITLIRKLTRYCAYQERCHQEVKDKLRQWRVPSKESDALLAYLIERNYLNEERFAKAYAGGKFRTKKWGRMRIQYALKQKGVSTQNIRTGLLEIDEEEYRDVLIRLIEKTFETTQDGSEFVRTQQVIAYLTGRGFEPQLIRELIQTINFKTES